MLQIGPCHVARLKYEKRVEASGGLLVGADKPECENNGDYKLKQCHGSTGYCWCVETKTGVEIPGTKKRGSVDCSEYEGEISEVVIFIKYFFLSFSFSKIFNGEILRILLTV